MEAPVEIDGVLPGNDLLLSSLAFLNFQNGVGDGTEREDYS